MPEQKDCCELCNHCVIFFFFFLHIGAVSGEMFRHMQNSEIIRKMTEEFDEVMQAMYLYSFMV